MRNAQLRCFVAASIVLAAVAAHAHDLRHGPIHIGHAWARPAASGGTAEVYFPLINRGTTADRLVGARTVRAATASLAEARADSHVASSDAVALPPNRPVALRPGRIHVRLEGLTAALVAGESFRLTLLFAIAGPAELTVMVEAEPGH